MHVFVTLDPPKHTHTRTVKAAFFYQQRCRKLTCALISLRRGPPAPGENGLLYYALAAGYFISTPSYFFSSLGTRCGGGRVQYVAQRKI